MEKVKKWWSARRLGSTDNINKKTDETALPSCKTEHEITSMKIKQLLEKQSYSKVVDVLREQSHNFVHKCLESFPFKALNGGIPESFPVWETLLTKLHNSEEGYIPKFPYAACDELVIQIAWLLESVSTNKGESVAHDLIPSCRRVLKCVYMQYNEVLENLYKEHDRVEHALYTLGLHLPLGSDFLTAQTIQQAIRDEVEASMADYKDALERLDEQKEKEVLTLSQALGEYQKPLENSDEYREENGGFLLIQPRNFPLAPNVNQKQLQERLYNNNCVITSLLPSRRKDNLPELVEILKERIRGDKEVLTIFGKIRQRNDAISDLEAVEPWLRRYQHAIECVIGMLKEIEKELEINPSKAESPLPLVLLRRDSLAQAQPVDEELEPIERPRSISLESGDPSPPTTFRRHSASLYDTYKVMHEEDSESTCGLDSRERNNPNRLSAHHYHHRPRSASPHKIFRVNGGPPLRSGSSKSINSSNGSTTNLVSGESSSVHDLHNTKDNQPLPAFTRVQSLKTNYSVQVVAGRRKKSHGNGIFNSTSTGNMSTKKKKSRKLFRSGSGGLDSGRKMSADTSSNDEGGDIQMELNQAKDTIHELKKRERELTDRLSEQAQRLLQDSERFEDILLGTSRPTMVIQRYEELFSQGRMDALDAIDQDEDQAFGNHLVLDVFKSAYECSRASLEQLHSRWRGTLDVETRDDDSVAVKHLESAVGLYLKRVCRHHDVADIAKRVNEYLDESYGKSDVYKAAARTDAFQTYVSECAKVSWDLCVQTPPMVIECNVREFNPEMHKRFHMSNPDSDQIAMYHWPTLLQTNPGPILSQGIVQT